MKDFRARLKQNCCFLPKFIFKCIGINFYDNESKLYKVYSSLMLFMNATYGFSSLHSVIYNLDNFDVVINSVFNMISGWIACFIALVMVYNRKLLRRIFNEIERIQEQRNTEQEGQSLVYSVNKKVLLLTVIFYLSLSVLFTSSLIQRILEDDGAKWNTPTMDVTFLNKTRSPNFEIAWAYQVFAVTAVATCFCFSDFLVATIMVDLTIQFYILKSTIKQVFNFSIDKARKNIASSEGDNRNILRENVKQVVLHHLSLIDLVNDAESVCSVITFLNVIGNLGMIGSSLYYASVVPLLDFKAMQSWLEVFMITLTLFFICYWGSQISLASESIANVCYEIDFVGMDIRFQKDLLMIIMRSQKPVNLTVGKFAILSITVFVWIIRTSYSYLMVLRNSNQSQIA